MKNKQPFYHRIEVTFTATADLSDELKSDMFELYFERFLMRQFKGRIVKASVEVESFEAEAGDPHDSI